MKKRWAPAFTVVEILIIIVVIGILAGITVVAYRTVQDTARVRAAQSDLLQLASVMQQDYQKQGTYPTTVPGSFQPSPSTTLTVVRSGMTTTYNNLTPVQNGVLFAQICGQLLAEGVGRGVDQGGDTNDYISGCGNWNDNSTQITGWTTKQWQTPVTKAQLSDYAAAYSVSAPYHKQAQETAVKNFYTQLIQRMEAQGGTFPITSFWDYWATPANGGVQEQPIEQNAQSRATYCAEASTNNGADVWRIDQSAKLEEGKC